MTKVPWTWQTAAMVDAVPGPIPHLCVADGAAAIDFYRQAFAAQELARHPAEDGRRVLHAVLGLQGGIFYLCDHFPEFESGNAPPGAASPVTIHINVDDVDAVFARAIATGATALLQPMDAFWGDRYAKLRDPFGHVWSLAHPLSRAGG